MNSLLIKQGKIIVHDSIIEGDIVINNGKISRIAPTIDAKVQPTLFLGGKFYVSPGLIDLHTHGALGYDFLDASLEGNRKIIDFCSSHGTTYLLATIGTAPTERMLKAAEAIIALKDDRIGGIYFEGPFLSPERKGAQPEQWLVTPSIDRYRELYAKTKGRMRILALAPELPGAKEIIHQALSDNVIPALAHSNASYEEAMEAIDQGVRHFTHLYNGMRVFHHRDPGAVAAALLRQEVTVELIADGIHVHPAVLKTVIKLKGIENICLITDSISAAGMKDGSYFFSGQEIIVERGIARLATGDSLAGSTLTLDKAIRNLLEWGVSFPHAIKMASSTPARVLGIQHSKGSITPGKDADLVIFDQDLKVRAVFVRGRLVYNELEEASLALGGDQ